MSIVTLKPLKMLVICDDSGNSEYHSIIIIITTVTVLMIMMMTVKKRRLSLVLTGPVIISGGHRGAVPGMRTPPPSWDHLQLSKLSSPQKQKAKTKQKVMKWGWSHFLVVRPPLRKILDLPLIMMMIVSTTVIDKEISIMDVDDADFHFVRRKFKLCSH